MVLAAVVMVGRVASITAAVILTELIETPILASGELLRKWTGTSRTWEDIMDVFFLEEVSSN